MKPRRPPLVTVNANINWADPTVSDPFATRSKLVRTPNKSQTPADTSNTTFVIKKDRIHSVVDENAVPLKDGFLVVPVSTKKTKLTNATPNSPSNSQANISLNDLLSSPPLGKKARRISIDDVMQAIRCTPMKNKDEELIAKELIGRLLPSEFKDYVRVFKDSQDPIIMSSISKTTSKISPRSKLLNMLSTPSPVTSLTARMAYDNTSAVKFNPISESIVDRMLCVNESVELIHIEPESQNSLDIDIIVDPTSAIVIVEACNPINQSPKLVSTSNSSSKSLANPFKPKKALQRTPPKLEPQLEVEQTEYHSKSPSVVTETEPQAQKVISNGVTMEFSDPYSDTEPELIVEESIITQPAIWTEDELNKATEVVRRMSIHDTSSLNSEDLLALKHEIDLLKNDIESQRQLLQQSIEDKARLQDQINSMVSKILETEEQQIAMQEQLAHQEMQSEKLMNEVNNEVSRIKSEINILETIKNQINARREQRAKFRERNLLDLSMSEFNTPSHQSTSDLEGKCSIIKSTTVEMKVSIIESVDNPFSEKNSSLDTPIAKFVSITDTSKHVKPYANKSISALSIVQSIIGRLSTKKDTFRSSKFDSTLAGNGLSTSNRSCFCKPLKECVVQCSIDYPEVHETQVDEPDSVFNHQGDIEAFNDMPEEPISFHETDISHQNIIKPIVSRPSNSVMDDICITSNHKSKKTASKKSQYNHQSQLHQRWNSVATDDLNNLPAMAKNGNMMFVPISAISNPRKTQDVASGRTIVKALFTESDDANCGVKDDAFEKNDEGRDNVESKSFGKLSLDKIELNNDNDSDKIEIEKATSRKRKNSDRISDDNSRPKTKKNSNIPSKIDESKTIEIAVKDEALSDTEPKKTKKHRKEVESVEFPKEAHKPKVENKATKNKAVESFVEKDIVENKMSAKLNQKLPNELTVDKPESFDDRAKQTRKKNSRKEKGAISEPLPDERDLSEKPNTLSIKESIVKVIGSSHGLTESNETLVKGNDKKAIANQSKKTNQPNDRDVGVEDTKISSLSTSEPLKIIPTQRKSTKLVDKPVVRNEDVLVEDKHPETELQKPLSDSADEDVANQRKKRGRKPKTHTAIDVSLKVDEVENVKPFSNPTSDRISSTIPKDSSNDRSSKIETLSPVMKSNDDNPNLVLDSDDLDEEAIIFAKPDLKQSKKRKIPSSDKSESLPVKEMKIRVVEANSFPVPNPKAVVPSEKAASTQLFHENIENSPVRNNVKQIAQQPAATPTQLITSRSSFSVARATSMLNTSISGSVRSTTSTAASGFVIPKLKKRY